MEPGSTAVVISPEALAAIAASQKLDLGAFLLGCVIQAIFYGNSLSFLWRYMTTGRAEDPQWYILSIGIAWLLCTFSVFMMTGAVWVFVFGALFQGATVTSWTVDFFLIVNTVAATLIRVLYVSRLGKLCLSLGHFHWRRSFIVMLMLTVLLSVVDIVFSITIGVRLYTAGGIMKTTDYGSIKSLFYLAFATGIAADLLIAALMCMSLHNARTAVRRNDSVINSVVVYTVQTGLLVDLVEVGGLISFLVMPKSKLFIAFCSQVGVLYLTSLLSSLNTGRFVKKRVQQPICVNFSALDHIVVDPGPPTANCTSYSTAPLRSLLMDEEDSQSLYGHGDYYAEGKDMVPDIEQPIEQEPLTSPVSVMRPRAFTLPSYDRRPCT